MTDVPGFSLLKTERHGGDMPPTWFGMRFATLWRTLAAGGFDMTLNCVPRVALPAMVAPFNSLAAALTEVRYGRAIDEVELEPPVFVIGHWRTGTTLLHELLAEDPELAAPTVYQTFFPNTFLVAPNLGAWLGGMLAPTRPFDNVILGHDRPSEEEFALLNMGLGTPYQSLAYPRHGLSGLPYVDLVDLDDAEREAWETGLCAAAEAPPPGGGAAAPAQIAASHRAYRHAAAALPRRAFRACRAQSVRYLSVHRTHVEGARLLAGLPQSGARRREPEGDRARSVRAAVCGL